MKNCITNFNAVTYIFLVWDYHIYILPSLTESLLASSQLSTFESFLLTVASLYIVDATVGYNNFCIITKINKTHLIVGFMHVFDIQKKKYWVQHLSLRKICNFWHWRTAIYDWDGIRLWSVGDWPNPCIWRNSWPVDRYLTYFRWLLWVTRLLRSLITLDSQNFDGTDAFKLVCCSKVFQLFGLQSVVQLRDLAWRSIWTADNPVEFSCLTIYNVHCRGGWRLGFSRFTSVQLVTGYTIR